MLKKLKEKKLIEYENYGKVSLTAEGRRSAIEVLCKHRLWEAFLYEKMEFTWDEVHEKQNVYLLRQAKERDMNKVF